MIYRIVALCLFILWSVSPVSAIVRQEQFYSTVLKKTMKYNLYLPANYDAQVRAGKRFPVVYLLHSLNLTCDAWTIRSGAISPRMDMTIDSVPSLVCVAPDDGTTDSWWLDSPVRGSNTSTYLVTEFKHRIDSILATMPDRAHTGVCGTSMGGYGALHNSTVNANVFCAVWSAVAVTDLTVHKTDLRIQNVLGPYDSNIARWNTENVISNISRFKSTPSKPLYIGFHTNAGDNMRDENVRLHNALDSAGIAHQFILNPTGGHSYPDSVQMVAILKFFAKSFGLTAANEAKPVVWAKPITAPRYAKIGARAGTWQIRVVDKKKAAVYSVIGAKVKASQKR